MFYLSRKSKNAFPPSFWNEYIHFLKSYVTTLEKTWKTENIIRSPRGRKQMFGIRLDYFAPFYFCVFLCSQFNSCKIKTRCRAPDTRTSKQSAQLRVPWDSCIPRTSNPAALRAVGTETSKSPGGPQEIRVREGTPASAPVPGHGLLTPGTQSDSGCLLYPGGWRPSSEH